MPLRLVARLGAGACSSTWASAASGVYRIIFYLPALVPPVAATIVFILLFNLDTGRSTSILACARAAAARTGCSDPIWAKPALIILGLWPLGVETLVFLAGLKEIPQDLLDAAAVDGAEPVAAGSSASRSRCSRR